MIKVPDSNPAVVSFVQKGVDTNAGVIAATQVAKMSHQQVEAQSAFDNATYRLRKATENLKTAEIEYFSAVEKNAASRDGLRMAYNNALAGFRDADALMVKCAQELELANAALAGVREIAKAGISSAAELKQAVKDAKTAEDRKAAVEAAEKMKLMFFLPKGWKAEAEGKTEDKKEEAVEKREFSADKREALAEEGKAMPDGSYPIVTAGDLKNAVQSYGRAKNKEEVKAHIIDRAKKLGLEDSLPEGWIEKKDNSMINKNAILILCPHCLGGLDGMVSQCTKCDENGMTPYSTLEDYNNAGGALAFGKSFSTDSLLTRTFEKSEGFQTYIFTKYGVAGRSGDRPGHEFHGNQHTGGKWGVTDSRGNTRHSSGPHNTNEGWLETAKRYDRALPTHIANAEAAVRRGDAASAAGRHDEAAAHYREAKGHYTTAAGSQKANQLAHEAHGAWSPERDGETWSGGEAAPQGVTPNRAWEGARQGASQEQADMYRANHDNLRASAAEASAKADAAAERAASNR